MKRIALIALVALAVQAEAFVAAGDDHAGRMYEVSCQGFIRPAGSLHLQISPGGTHAMQIMPVQEGYAHLAATLTITARNGASHRLAGLRGNAFFVSDVGRVITLEIPDSNVPPTILTVFDLAGRELCTRSVAGLCTPVLSSDGGHLAYRTREGIVLLDLITLAETRYPAMAPFAAGPDGRLAGVAGTELLVFGEPSPETSVVRLSAPPRTEVRPQRMAFTSDASRVLLLYGHELREVDPATGSARVLFAVSQAARLRDFVVGGEAIYIGMRRVVDGCFVGELLTLNRDGEILGRQLGPSRRIPRAEDLPRTTRGIPWPLAPDEQHSVGNTYGEYQNYGGGGYLHPGVDAMGSPGQPVYSVSDGVVKAVLTTGGEWYWRVAVGDSVTTGTCEGYLYAHLDEYSIAVDVGDPIETGQYLGDLVAWPVYDFTHIHFARIEDSGTQWYGHWLCTDNPHLDFDNQSETEPPFFEPARDDDLLAFCDNQTSYYQDPAALQGEVDIIAHVGDRIESDWVCTIQEIRYTIYRVGFPEFPVVDDKLAVFFDMALDTYQGGPIDPFLVALLFKRDGVCHTEGDYGSREFYHIITNSNGDQVYEDSDLWEAWDTTLLPDGDYVIRVSIADVVGNTAVDSMTVTTVNGDPSRVAPVHGSPRLVLRQTSPNPSIGGAAVSFTLPLSAQVSLSVLDAAGRSVRSLIAECLPAGNHAVSWDGRNFRGERAATGVYFWRLTAGPENRSAKLVLLQP
jgi:hypothetical protein